MLRSGWRSRFVAAVVLAAAVGGCGEPGTTPSGTPPPAGFLLRASLTQALAPENVFAWTPPVTITGDRILVTTGPVPAIFPGPLLPNLRGREISQAGYDRIVGEARSLGLLDGNGDFSPPDVAPGSQLGRIELLVDGELRVLTGDPNRVIQCIRAPCVPPPATPEAFAALWQALSDLPGLLPDELGPEFGYRPDGYALLIGIQPPDDAGIAPQLREWPLDTPLAELGRPIGDAAGPRCGTVEGDDAATLTTAFEGANQLTRWFDRGAEGAGGVAIAVRALLPGEDVCLELFGIGE